MDEYGVTGPKWRLKITDRKIIKNSDFAEIVFEVYPPKTRKAYHGTIKINFVRGTVYWDTYFLTPDRF